MVTGANGRFNLDDEHEPSKNGKSLHNAQGPYPENFRDLPAEYMRFYAKLRRTHNFTRACEQIGWSRTKGDRMRRTDPLFKAVCEEALEAGVDNLESAAMRRAVFGWLEPVYYRGQKVGYVRRFNPALTIFMLKANRPDKYSDRVTSGVDGADDYAQAILAAMAAMKGSVPNGPSEN